VSVVAWGGRLLRRERKDDARVLGDFDVAAFTAERVVRRLSGTRPADSGLPRSEVDRTDARVVAEELLDVLVRDATVFVVCYR
jgi:hypothetical protein